MEPLTTGEKMETAALTLILLVFLLFGLGTGAACFYWLVWGVS